MLSDSELLDNSIGFSFPAPFLALDFPVLLLSLLPFLELLLLRVRRGAVVEAVAAFFLAAVAVEGELLLLLAEVVL